MSVQVQETEAPAHSLEELLPHEIRPLFRRQHLNRDVIIGLIGDIGAGKSIGGGLISLLDYMLQGDPCFCNMRLKATFDVDSETAYKWNAVAGPITYEAQPLDKYKFLKFSPEYRRGVFFTHEFNIWLADARRSQSTLNLETNDVSQELRKLESAWIYDCLHEMFVDNRVRDATDLFIQTSDTALTPRGMANKQPQGLEFEWWISCMTQKGAAIMDSPRFRDTKQPIGPIYVRGRQLWGLIDTNKREIREKYRPRQNGKDFDIELSEPPEIVEARNKWGWLFEAIKKLHDEGYDEISNKELWQYLQIEERGITKRSVGEQLNNMGIKKRQAPQSVGGYYYLIDQFDLGKGIFNSKKEAVINQ